MATVKLDRIEKAFGNTPVLKGLNLDIRHGEFVVLLGPSGCGKSTLLRVIAGLEDQSRGSVFIAGEPVDHLPPARRGIAMVFQSYALYPHLDVAGNWALGLKQAGEPRAVIDARIEQAARILKLHELLARKPAELSGGQRQRVAIGRAIVRQPRVFLFDEPLSNLDAALRAQVRFEIGRLLKQLHSTMIYVTHDQVEAMTLADKIVVMEHGVVQQIGTPAELYRTPANRFVAGFIGSPQMNFLAARTIGSGRLEVTGIGALELDDPASSISHGSDLIIGVRPDGFALVDANDTAVNTPLRGPLVLNEYLGREAYLHLELANGQTVVVEVSPDNHYALGDVLGLAPKPGAVHFFDAASGRRLKAGASP